MYVYECLGHTDNVSEQRCPDVLIPTVTTGVCLAPAPPAPLLTAALGGGSEGEAACCCSGRGQRGRGCLLLLWEAGSEGDAAWLRRFGASGGNSSAVCSQHAALCSLQSRLQSACSSLQSAVQATVCMQLSAVCSPGYSPHAALCWNSSRQDLLSVRHHKQGGAEPRTQRILGVVVLRITQQRYALREAR